MTTGTTKVHLGIDGNEMVKTAFLTPGQAVDCAQAEALLAGLGHDETVIGDRTYDTDAILDLIETAGATAVIPSRSSRNSPRLLDRETYRTRNLVERFCGKTKEFRRVATHYDKTACNFLSAGSRSVGSRTNYLSPQPKQITVKSDFLP